MTRMLIAALALVLAAGALAQGNYPTRPVIMVVGFAPGGGTDTVARIVAKKFEPESLGQQVLGREQASGAGGNIATDFCGACGTRWLHHLCSAMFGSLAVAPHIDSPIWATTLCRDFAPITMGGGIRQRARGAAVAAGAISLADFVEACAG